MAEQKKNFPSLSSSARAIPMPDSSEKTEKVFWVINPDTRQMSKKELSQMWLPFPLTQTWRKNITIFCKNPKTNKFQPIRNFTKTKFLNTAKITTSNATFR